MHQQPNASGVRVVAILIVIPCDSCGDGHNTDRCLQLQAQIASPK